MIDYCLEKASLLPVSEYRQRHYAVAQDYKGRIIAESPNSFSKTHTVQAQYARKVGRPDAIYLHAEMAVLIKCANLGRSKDVHKIVVARVDKKGGSTYSCPCKICSLAIKEFGVRAIEFSV